MQEAAWKRAHKEARSRVKELLKLAILLLDKHQKIVNAEPAFQGL